MAVKSIPNTFSAGSTILSAEHNENFSTIYNEFNGNIENANIKSNAAIADTKLAQIATAGKVSGAALTSLNSIPSGGGTIPIANIPYLDEDDMSTDSATQVPTQQSVKAYVDSQSLSTKVGTVIISSTGSVSVTGVGFQPKAVLFICGADDKTTTRSGNAVGFWDGTTLVSMGGAWIDGDSSGRGFALSNFEVASNAATPTTIVAFTGTSLDSDGFTINVTTASSDYNCYYLAIR